MPLRTAGLPDFGSNPDRLLKIQRKYPADKFLKIEEAVDLHDEKNEECGLFRDEE